MRRETPVRIIEVFAWSAKRTRMPETRTRPGTKGQDLVLDVLTVNHRAQALYQRLGMTEVARHGDGNIKITMRSLQPHQ